MTNHNFAPRTNQQVLTLFVTAFGTEHWRVVVRAGLSWLAFKKANTYDGPDVEMLTLTDDEKSRLIGLMG